jgi:transcriptional regulator with XRE-family HTH domain
MGLTQSQLQARTGIDVRYLSRIEQGKVNVTLTTLHKLADAVGCPRLLLLPSSRSKALEAELCCDLAELARTGKIKELEQTQLFLKHIVGHKPGKTRCACPLVVCAGERPMSPAQRNRNRGN